MYINVELTYISHLFVESPDTMASPKISLCVLLIVAMAAVGISGKFLF